MTLPARTGTAQTSSLKVKPKPSIMPLVGRNEIRIGWMETGMAWRVRGCRERHNHFQLALALLGRGNPDHGVREVWL